VPDRNDSAPNVTRLPAPPAAVDAVRTPAAAARAHTCARTACRGNSASPPPSFPSSHFKSPHPASPGALRHAAARRRHATWPPWHAPRPAHVRKLVTVARKARANPTGRGQQPNHRGTPRWPVSRTLSRTARLNSESAPPKTANTTPAREKLPLARSGSCRRISRASGTSTARQTHAVVISRRTRPATEPLPASQPNE